MGSWAKVAFGKEKFESVGIIVAGVNSKEFRNKILSYLGKVVSYQDTACHNYLVKKAGKIYPVVFNVYGAATTVDTIALLHDGGCRNIIFVGYAYGGFKNLEIGSIIIPDKSYHFEGIYHPIEPDRKAGFPDKELKNKLEELLRKNKINYSNGSNISVPAVTFQLPHDNPEYKKINPVTVEMEFASCLSRAKDLGMRAVGALIISDNRSSGLDDTVKRGLRHKSKTDILKTVIKNIKEFNLPRLKRKKEFNIDEHLASIIEDGTTVNVYRRKKK